MLGRITKLMIFLAIFLASTSMYAQAFYPDGKTLLEKCTASINFMDKKTYNENDRQWCIGFMQGLESLHFMLAVNSAKSDKLEDINKRSIYCLPDKITLGDLIRTTVNYINKNPKDISRSAATLTVEGLTDAYPCKQ